jgi:hypothetical protein
MIMIARFLPIEVYPSKISMSKSIYAGNYPINFKD